MLSVRIEVAKLTLVRAVEASLPTSLSSSRSHYPERHRGGPVTSFSSRAWLSLCLLSAVIVHAQNSPEDRPPINLPTSKMLTVPSPGRIGSTNSFPATMVLSPDGHYAALLNDGYGTQETLAHQSISVLNLDTNQIAEFPDARFSDVAHQSYFHWAGLQL